MYTEMALDTRTTLGPVRRLATVLAVGVLAGMASIVVAPAAAADDDEPSIVTQVEFDDSDDSKDDDSKDGDDVKKDDVVKDGPASVVHRSGAGGPDAFIIMEHGKKPVFFCDKGNSRKQHNICTKVTGSTRF